MDGVVRRLLPLLRNSAYGIQPLPSPASNLSTRMTQTVGKSTNPPRMTIQNTAVMRGRPKRVTCRSNVATVAFVLRSVNVRTDDSGVVQVDYSGGAWLGEGAPGTSYESRTLTGVVLPCRFSASREGSRGGRLTLE